MDIGTIIKVTCRLMLFRLTKFHFSPVPFFKEAGQKTYWIHRGLMDWTITGKVLIHRIRLFHVVHSDLNRTVPNVFQQQ